MKKFLSQNILAVLLILGIAVVANYLSSHVSLRWDLTEDKEYTLSQATRDIVAGLEDRLTIKLYYSKDLPPMLTPVQEQVSDLIRELRAHAKNGLVIENVDPDSNEEKERETLTLGIVPLQLNIVEKDKREVKKAYMGMVIYYRDKKEVIPVLAQVANLEYQVDLSVLKLTQKELPKIGVFVGGEKEMFQQMSQLVEPIGDYVEITDAKDLKGKKLNVLLVIDPVDIEKDFLKALDDVMAEGTHVLIFASQVHVSDDMTPTVVHSGMDEWLSEKGVGISNGFLLDTQQNVQAGFQAGGMQIFMPYHFWVKALRQDLNEKHPITAELEEIIYPWTHVVEPMGSKNLAWSMEELVHSSKVSFLQKEEVPTVSPQYVQNMTELPELKSHPLSVVLKNRDEKFGKIFLTASSTMFQDRFLQQFGSNILFLENLLEYTSWGDKLIGVRSRGKTARPLEVISDAKRSFIKWGHMTLVPVFSVLLGVAFLYVHKKRRDKFISELV